MTWYAVYVTATGRLVSVGQTVAEPLPDHLQAVTLAGPPADGEMWDATTKAFVARPPKVLVDRLQDIITHPDYADDLQLLWSSLNATQRTRLRNALIRLLGPQRWRAAGESVAIGGDAKNA
jgi:hypothetical protein